MDGANLRPGQPESISRRLGLVQPGLAPLLQLRGICCEAIGPVVLRVNGHGFILMPCRRIAAAWPPLARAHGLHNGCRHRPAPDGHRLQLHPARRLALAFLPVGLRGQDIA